MLTFPSRLPHFLWWEKPTSLMTDRTQVNRDLPSSSAHAATVDRGCLPCHLLWLRFYKCSSLK